jgi:hypothetical protein
MYLTQRYFSQYQFEQHLKNFFSNIFGFFFASEISSSIIGAFTASREGCLAITAVNASEATVIV